MTAEEYSRTTKWLCLHTGYNTELYIAALAHFNIYPTKYEFDKYMVHVSDRPLKTQCFRKEKKVGSPKVKKTKKINKFSKHHNHNHYNLDQYNHNHNHNKLCMSINMDDQYSNNNL